MFGSYPQSYPWPRNEEGPAEAEPSKSFEWNEKLGSPSRTRTCDHSINSRMLYQLSYRGPWPRPARRDRCLAPTARGCQAPKSPPGGEAPRLPGRAGSARARTAALTRRPRAPRGPREASWRSGHAEDCKSLHPGSIPGEASITCPRRWPWDRPQARRPPPRRPPRTAGARRRPAPLGRRRPAPAAAPRNGRGPGAGNGP